MSSKQGRGTVVGDPSQGDPLAKELANTNKVIARFGLTIARLEQNLNSSLIKFATTVQTLNQTIARLPQASSKNKSRFDVIPFNAAGPKGQEVLELLDRRQKDSASKGIHSP